MLCLAAILGAGRTAGAQPLDALEEGLLLTNTIPDVDLDAITRIFGYTQNQVLSMSGTITPSGFSETLSGMYQGKLLDVTYTGITSGDTITWTTGGSYGGVSFTGGGSNSAVFSTTSSTFSIHYVSSWVLSPKSASDDLTISGGFLPGDPSFLTYTGTAGLITINGLAEPAPAKYNSIQCPYTGKVAKGNGPFTDIDGPDGKPTIIDDVKMTNVVPGQLYEFTGTIRTVPEPASLILLAIGSIGLFAYGRCRA